MSKADCYKCKHRGNVPGDAHSCCQHPKVEDNPLMTLMAMLGAVNDMPSKASTELNIKGNPHGIKNGWFRWPVNFDPIWLENCDGFEEKEDVQKDI